jgi:tetratricopeptide (TPR) repeat protein
VHRIHEELREADGSEPIGCTIRMPRLRHRGYAPGFFATRGKLERNLRLLHLRLAEAPDEASSYYYLGRDLIAGGDPEAGLAMLAEVPHHQPSDQLMAMTVWMHVTALAKLGRDAELIACVADLPEEMGVLPDVWLIQGYAYLRQQQPEAAAASFRRAMGTAVPEGSHETAGVRTWRPLLGLAAAAEAQGAWQEARTLRAQAAALGAPGDPSPS